MGEKPHSKYLHAYAIVRFDFPVTQDDPENSVMVVKVLLSKDLCGARDFSVEQAQCGEALSLRTKDYTVDTLKCTDDL